MQFIICVIECLRKDHVGCCGYTRPTTPHIDALARRSILYRNSRSVFDRTLPSFCALTSGTHEIDGAGRNPDYPMLPKILAAHGVPSFLISANHVPFASRIPTWGYTRVMTFMKEEIRSWAEDLGHAHTLVEHARRLDGDFYVVIHFKETHPPYTARRFYNEFLPPEDPGVGLAITDRPGLPGSIYRGYMIGQERSAGFYVSQYDGAIRYVDEEVGRLIEAFPDAHIVITGDHGEAMGESDRYFCHGYGMFHELLEVPLIYHTPEGRFNIELEPVSHLNLPSTVLDAFGIALPAEYTKPCLPIRQWEDHRVVRLDEDARAQLRALGYM